MPRTRGHLARERNRGGGNYVGLLGGIGIEPFVDKVFTFLPWKNALAFLKVSDRNDAKLRINC